MAFHDTLKRCREAKGLTPDQAATAGDVSVHQDRNWERGVGEPTLSALKKLAGAFPALADLRVDGLSGDGGEALAQAGSSALRDLDVGFSAGGRGAEARNRAAAAALLLSPRFPNLSGFRVVSVPGLGGAGLLLSGAGRGPTLRYLGLMNVGLVPEDCEGIAHCPALRGLMALDLGSNAIGSAGAAALAGGDWPRLLSLDLSSCKVGQTGAVALAGAKRMPEVQWLQLNCNEFGPEGCKAFTPTALPHLRRLSLSNCGGTTGTKVSLRRRFGRVVEM